MDMQFVVKVNGQMYEISELVTKITYTDKLNDGCSKLEFSYINDDLVIPNGSGVSFVYDGAKIFSGFVFKHSQSKGKEISVTAYDQLRYAKAKDTIKIEKNTVSDIVKKMCNYFGLVTGTIADTGYILPNSVQDDKTWLDIVYGGIADTLTNYKTWFTLRDEFNTIALRNIQTLKLDLVLGDESMVYDYDYEKSIDEDFYNQIKLVSANDKTKKADVYMPFDSDSIKKYGILQYFEVLDKNYNPSQARSKADILLSLYNREAETLTLKCLGDTRVRAGSSFYGNIEDIALNKRLIVRTATHEFLPVHTMDLEVAI